MTDVVALNDCTLVILINNLLKFLLKLKIQQYVRKVLWVPLFTKQTLTILIFLGQ